MRKRLGGLVATAAMLFAACGGTATAVPATPPPASTTPGSAVPSAVASPVASLSPLDQQLFGTTFKPPTGTVPGGTLVMGEWQPPDNLNPFYSTALTTVEAYSPALRALATLTADGKYIPDLASSVPTVDNGGVVISGTTYTVAVTLRSGLQWSDGTPVTMNDWKATWQFANDPAQSGCQICTIGYPDISSIDVSADGLTGTFHYKDLFPGWLAMLTNPFFQQKWLGTLAVAKASAAALGLPYAFASHFAPGDLMEAIAIYRSEFKPSAQLARPYTMVGVNVVAADTDAAARHLFTSVQQQFTNMFRRARGLLQPPIDDIESYWSQVEKVEASNMLRYAFVGSRESVRRGLQHCIEETAADEIMVASAIYEHAARLRSYEILSEVAASQERPM